MLKSARYKPVIIIIFLGVLLTPIVYNVINQVNTAMASDDSGNSNNSSYIQQFTAIVYEKNTISTKDGYPVYSILFVKHDESVFPYCGGDAYTNRYYGGNHRGNAMNIYTKVIVGHEYHLTMDEDGNILTLNGASV